jgi:hypothetical protein
VAESPTPCVLVVADPGRVAELTEALSEPLPRSAIELVSSSGGDDTIELFEAKKPRVVVLTASLEVGDAGSLIEVLRGMVPRDELVIVLVGDGERGPIRNALDAIDLKPDRFVSRPLAAKALRFAVGSGLDNVARALGELPPASEGSGTLQVPENEEDRVTQPIGSRTTTPLRGSGPSPAAGVEVAAGHARAASSAGVEVAPGHARAAVAAGHAGATPSDSGDIAARPVRVPGGNGASDTALGGAASAGATSASAASAGALLVDAGSVDAGSVDAASVDAGSVDAGSVAAGSADAGSVDAASADAMPTVAAPEDAGPQIAGADTDASAAPIDDAAAAASGLPNNGELPFVRSGTAPRFSSPVDMGEVPTVVPRVGTRSMLAIDDKAAARVPRAPTDRGTGVPPLPEGPLGDGADRDELFDSNAASVLADRVPRAATEKGTGIAMVLPATPDEALALDPQARRAAMRARWEALADSIHQLDDEGEDDADEIAEITEERAEPPPQLAEIESPPRKKGSTNPDFLPVPPHAPWRPGTTPDLRDEPEVIAPPREPTLIIPDEVPARVTPPSDAVPAIPMALRATQPSDATHTGHSTQSTASGPPAHTTQATSSAPSAQARGPDDVERPTAERGGDEIQAPRERWSHPVLLSELIDRSRDSSRELLANVGGGDDLAGIDDLDDDIIVGHPVHTPPPHVMRRGRLEALDDLVALDGGADESPFEREPSVPAVAAEPPPRPSEDKLGGRDFARQLRAKMSKMAQRLFSSDSAASPPTVDVRPRHDHHTEIDLAALGEEPALVAVTEIERAVAEPVQMTTSPGTWDTQVRERGLPDSGEIVRGVSDVSMILARMFALTFTGRVGFRKDDVEKVIYFDGGRPVFASSNEPGDRMGQLLVREGKITASQYERCQVVVAQSGRRMGEILVDFGYLKRRELLPAVRRHVEDIIYSLFGWDRGHYHVTPEPSASAERIRLSRHPASLVLEGIRRKLDRSTLEKVLGPASTVIEVPDRERLGGILNTGDLAQEERAALAAFDGQTDLGQVARATGGDVADVLPLAWGLCVLGLATARRAEIEHDESTALVGETDLAIDRERVRARWQLVAEADYFALLGVRRDATGFEIRRAYQAARRDFAPDGFPTDLRRELARELEEIGVVLDEAFRVLRDDRLRQTYLAHLIE